MIQQSHWLTRYVTIHLTILSFVWPRYTEKTVVNSTGSAAPGTVNLTVGHYLPMIQQSHWLTRHVTSRCHDDDTALTDG